MCPAGSPEAFDAAIDAGADAVYLGGADFNARLHAKNFTPADIAAAVSRAHAYGVKVYITLNTLVTDRELDAFVGAAESAYLCGADGLIVADLGGAAAIRRCIPDKSFELHASTQLSGHNADAARILAGLGFSRMVCAREMSAEDIRNFVKKSPIEAEVFVHGALCVCHSGQCLFSSIVGGRSGNRGECAQPCRLPYRLADGKTGYPLSLRDLSLARHVPELIRMGVASFKIEGRMKSPEYVRGVASVWRRLIDENRGADDSEMRKLAQIFSRGGFTDGYYTRNIGRGMLGVRSESDKKSTSEISTPEKSQTAARRIPLTFEVSLRRGEPASLTVLPHGVTVYGEIPFEAKTAPLDRDTVIRNISKLGGTPYEARQVNVVLDEGIMLPVSMLNSLRRDAIAKLDTYGRDKNSFCGYSRQLPQKSRTSGNTAVFRLPSAITAVAKEYFDIIYLPLEAFDGSTDGVLLPAVIFDSEKAAVRGLLERAVSLGARHALVGNIGHLPLVREAGLIPHGDFRLNITNGESARSAEMLGFEDMILSPELTLPQLRDIGGQSGAIVYGRLPLMVTEKCVSKEISDCRTCAAGRSVLTDRKNMKFPVFREWQHRNVIFNSVPVYMADRLRELDANGIIFRHFIFTDETPETVDRIINAYKLGLAADFPIRRIK